MSHISLFRLQVEGVSGVDVSKALSDGIVTVYAEQRTFIRSLMEAVRKLVSPALILAVPVTDYSTAGRWHSMSCGHKRRGLAYILKRPE